MPASASHLSPALGSARSAYTFCLAENAHDLEQIEALNYRTFVREIGQHPDHGNDRLRDKFDYKNTYIVARHAGRVVGMVALHDQPPFSVEKRLPAGMPLSDLGRHLMEVRLLAIEPGHRNSLVFAGLLERMLRHAEQAGCSHLLISGVADQAGLYKRLGFVELGPAVPEGAATFTPMIMPLGGLSQRATTTLRRVRRHIFASEGLERCENNHDPS